MFFFIVLAQDGVRRKSYSAAVIDGIKRNSKIYEELDVICERLHS